MIYNGGSAGSSDEWLRLAAERFADLRASRRDPGPHRVPVVGRLPRPVLPDSDATAFSNLIVRHAGDRGVLDGALVVDPAAATVSGRLFDEAGEPLSDRTISADAVVSGRSTVITEFDGVVPAARSKRSSQSG